MNAAKCACSFVAKQTGAWIFDSYDDQDNDYDNDNYDDSDDRNEDADDNGQNYLCSCA